MSGSEVYGVGPELPPPSPASRAAHQQVGPRQLEHEGSRCADCGVLLDWHGSECGMEVDDPRAESYFPPAGWAAPVDRWPDEDPIDHARRVSAADLGWEMDGEEPDDVL